MGPQLIVIHHYNDMKMTSLFQLLVTECGLIHTWDKGFNYLHMGCLKKSINLQVDI